MIFLATNQGIVSARRTVNWQIVNRSLSEKFITCIDAAGSHVLAGTEDGIFRSDDSGLTWQESSSGITHCHIRWLAFHPEINGLVWAGAEPAAVYLSLDGGVNWQERIEVARLRDQHHWTLPYSPEAGCARGVAFHGNRGYTAIEVGGVLRSDDAGATWALAAGSSGNPDMHAAQSPLIHPDVHSIYVHPSSPDLVFAPTGGGLYRSADGGSTWDYLYDCYCRAIWVEAEDPEHIILGPADDVNTFGRIEVSHNGGKTWMLASDGLAVPWRNNMIERFTQVGDELLAVLAEGQLICTSLGQMEWNEILPEVTGVNAAAWNGETG
jgi:photosystem II stability/assembly factor-like uncharacterized protein